MVSSHSFEHLWQVPVRLPSSEQVASFVVVHSVTECPNGSPLVSPQTVQVFGSVQVASLQICSAFSPSTAPHRTQCFGSRHVASTHSWLNAVPSVSPQLLHVLGASHDASSHSWVWPHPDNPTSIVPRTRITAIVKKTRFILTLPPHKIKKCANRSQRTEKRRLQLSPNKLK